MRPRHVAKRTEHVQDPSQPPTSNDTALPFLSRMNNGASRTCALRLEDRTAVGCGNGREGVASPPDGATFSGITNGRSHTCALRQKTESPSAENLTVTTSQPLQGPDTAETVEAVSPRPGTPRPAARGTWRTAGGRSSSRGAPLQA